MTEDDRIIVRVGVNFKSSLRELSKLRGTSLTDVILDAFQMYAEEKIFKNESIFKAKDELKDVLSWKQDNYLDSVFAKIQEDAENAKKENEILIKMRESLK